MTNYQLGLNITPDKIGYAIMDNRNNLLKPNGAKAGIGTRLFVPAETAEPTRLLRSARRTKRRRQWRLKYLNQEFKPELDKIDPAFLERLKDTWLSRSDDRRNRRQNLFSNVVSEAAFYKKYPTIYHLQLDLINHPEKKFDLEYIYLAVHTLIKKRGNFLSSTPVNSYEATKFDVTKAFDELNKLLKKIEYPFVELNTQYADSGNDILLNESLFKTNKIKKFQDLIIKKTKNKAEDTQSKKVTRQLLNALLNSQTRFDILLNQEIDDDPNWKFTLSDEDVDEKLSYIKQTLSDEQATLLNILVEWHNYLELHHILNGSSTIAEAMVNTYEQHGQDLKLLNKYRLTVNNNAAKAIKNLYLSYANGRRNNKDVKKAVGSKSLGREDFYDKLSKIIKKQPENDLGKQILAEIELGTFLPKITDKRNSAIPYQLNALELNKILKNQGKYYPFLIKPNPSKNKLDQKNAPYKITQLLTFKVPYYIGPMFQDEKNPHARFAWVVRKADGPVTPWNFYEKIDQVKSANSFIKRSIGTDTYLINEPVLPKSSLYYDRYSVLNELNSIKINGNKLPITLKQAIYTNVFKKYKKVTVKKLKDYLIENHDFKTVQIRGLADPSTFNSSLNSYHVLKNILGSKVDSPEYVDDLEKIIEWSTIFEDRSIFEIKLSEVQWLTDLERKKLIAHRFTGWGNLSKKLLVNMTPIHSESLLDQLWNTKKTFIQIINKEAFKAAIDKENIKVSKTMRDEDLINDSYASPANKKALHQAIKVIEDVVKTTGAAPKIISLKFNREYRNDVGNYFYNIYPKLRPFFIYGEYFSFKNNEKESNNYKPSNFNLKSFNFLWKLLNGKSDEICISGTNTPVFSRSNIINQLNRVYKFKYQNVSQETFIKHGALFDQTIYPTPAHDLKKRTKLIKTKNNKPVELYGGYSSQKNMYFSLVRIEKKNGSFVNKIVGVPQIKAKDLNKINDIKEYQKKLYEILEPIVMTSEAGKKVKNIVDFKILKEKIPYRQVIEDEGIKYTLGSAKYMYNFKQLYLSQEVRQIIADYVDDPYFRQHDESTNDSTKNVSEKLDVVFNAILTQINSFFTLFNKAKVKEKINNGSHKFYDLNIQDKILVIKNLLVACHANASAGYLKQINVNNTLVNTVVTLSDSAKFVYQSPSGIHETEKKIADLF